MRNTSLKKKLFFFIKHEKYVDINKAEKKVMTKEIKKTKLSRQGFHCLQKKNSG